MDNLESLSNFDLHAKCLEFGLPNVPVTDSSRNVLIKKLRASQNLGAAQTKSARRETIHVPATPTAKAVKETDDRSANRVNNRRTIGATAPPHHQHHQPQTDFSRREEKQAEKIVATAAAVVDRPSIRSDIHPIHQKEPVLEKPKAAVAPAATVVAAPAPISSTRRRSVREQNIGSITTVQEREPIIIESDDDEDGMLADIATKAEEQNKATLSRSEAMRPASLSKTATVTASYVEAPRAGSKLPIRQYDNVDPLYGTKKLPQSESRSQFAQPAAKSFSQMSQMSRPAPRYSSTQPLSSLRYSSVHEQYANTFYSPLMRRSTPAAASTVLPKPYYNENSDDTDVNDEEGAFQTPFLSNFARNLERLKVEPSGHISASPLSASGSIGGDIAMRRHKRSTLYDARAKGGGEKSLLALLHELWLELDRKYQLKRNFLLLLIILIVIFLYVLFSP